MFELCEMPRPLFGIEGGIDIGETQLEQFLSGITE